MAVNDNFCNLKCW